MAGTTRNLSGTSRNEEIREIVCEAKFTSIVRAITTNGHQMLLEEHEFGKSGWSYVDNVAKKAGDFSGGQFSVCKVLQWISEDGQGSHGSRGRFRSFCRVRRVV